MRTHGTTLTRTAVALGLLAGLAAAPADGQTIRPLVAEHHGEARGRLELVNEGNEPLVVVLNVQGFRVDAAGTVHDTPLDGARVKLSASSLRVPPRQTRYVFYEASAEMMPNWFVILARFSGYSRKEFSGVDVQLELPHFVYMLPSAAWDEADISVGPATIDPQTGKLVVVVENRGSNFGRIDSVDVRGAGQRASKGGFPLFPHSHRRIELDWSGNDEAATVLVRARDFTIERPLVLERP